MSKFVGKFRKNKDYNDDYIYQPKKRSRNEHAEIRKLKNLQYEDLIYDQENKNIPKKYRTF